MRNNINLYLDIDGVLLTKKQKLPEGLHLFLDFALTHYQCYWLTTHCKGDATTAVQYLSYFYPIELITKIKDIRATNWDTLKTEAIDFNHSFIWLDDYVFKAEKRVLKQHLRLKSLWIIDLNNKDELYQIMKKMKTFLKK